MSDDDAPAFWRVNPFVKPLVAPIELDPGQAMGPCPVSPDVPHCHGSEVQHTDGLAECLSMAGYCDAPGPGRHIHVHSCSPDVSYLYAYSCSRCC